MFLITDWDNGLTDVDFWLYKIKLDLENVIVFVSYSSATNRAIKRIRLS